MPETIVVLQHGDYAQAFTRFRQGLEETYHEQQFTVDYVAQRASEGHQVVVISCSADEQADTQLDTNLRAINISQRDLYRTPVTDALLDQFNPTRLIVRSPLTHVLRWAARHHTPALPLLADYLSHHPWYTRARYRQRKLIQSLNAPNVPVVANHNFPASYSLVSRGISPHRVLPFDYDSRISKHLDIANARAYPRADTFKLLCVGAVNEAKGVPDAITALASLARTGKTNLTLTIVGKGDIQQMTSLAQQLGVSNRVTFTDQIPLEQVHDHLRSHHLAIIPTRHHYEEGMPGTLYQALEHFVPVVLSDHPVFRRALGQTNLPFFQAANPDALATAITQLIDHPDRYEAQSRNAVDAWNKLRVPNPWSHVMDHFIRLENDDLEWFKDHSLAAIEAAATPPTSSSSSA